jgi:RNA polymerase sigma-70 factor (ECF subfamily)
MTEDRVSQALDRDLVERVQRGEAAAFDLLVRKYQNRVAAVISRYVRDWSEVQDVAQDTFIRAYRAIAGFRGDAQFSTWLHRIAVNTAKNHLAAHGRRPPGEDIEIEDAEQFESGLRLRDNDTPERELMRQQLEHAVLSAVEALPPELRDAITFREVEGMSYDEIALRMGCPIGTVRSRIFRAREVIDARMRPLLDHDDMPKRSHA